MCGLGINPTSSLLGGQSVQTGPGTEDRDSGDQCGYTSQQYLFCPSPSAPILSSHVTPLPGSHDELIPQGIKSKLGEIPDSRVGEVKDPWLQIWWRQRETLLLLLALDPPCFQLQRITPEKITQLRWNIELKAPGDLGFTCPPL